MGDVNFAERVKVAAISRIEADPTLVGIWGTGIFDNMEADREPPYGRIGTLDGIGFGGDGFRGSEFDFIIHGYSREKSRVEADAIASALVDLFTDDDGEMITLDLGGGVRGDFTVDRFTVDDGTGVQGEWTIRVFLNVTAAIAT